MSILSKLKNLFHRNEEKDIDDEPLDFIELFKDLKHTLVGKDTLFLVNDNNNEIRQHYDSTYEGRVDYDLFRKSVQSKKKFFKRRDMAYGLYAIPDKSVILQDQLPFDTDKPVRHVDNLGDVVSDLSVVIDSDDYDINDTHINRKSGVKVAAYILSDLHENRSYEEYLRLLMSKLDIVSVDDYKGDLLSTRNWSYGEGELKEKYLKVPTEKVKITDNVVNASESIHDEFKWFSNRASVYCKNENSYTNKKLLLLNDSSGHRIIPACLTYYREVFSYWDHWYFNKDLVEWFKPNDIIELRTERFLDNPLCPIVDEQSIMPIQVIGKFTRCSVEDNYLKVDAHFEDIHHMPVDCDCILLINSQVIDTKHVQNEYSCRHNVEIYDGVLKVKIILQGNPRLKTIAFSKQIEL
ncbi:MAG: hypothetical protein ACI4VJ_01680 [Methanosphaera sp.]